MKVYGGVEIRLHAFLTSAIDWDEWSASQLRHSTRCETAPGNHLTGEWVEHRVGLNVIAKRKYPFFALRFFLKKHLQSFADLWPTLMGFLDLHIETFW
jgi:hypothetical protein